MLRQWDVITASLSKSVPRRLRPTYTVNFVRCKKTRISNDSDSTKTKAWNLFISETRRLRGASRCLFLDCDIHVEDDLRPAVLGRGLSATTDEPTKFHGSSPTQSSRRLVCSLRIAIDAKEKAEHHANTVGTLSLVPLRHCARSEGSFHDASSA